MIETSAIGRRRTTPTGLERFLADVLQGLRVLVLSSDGPNGLNPLDLSAVLRKFEVK